jgi:membrane protein implicated in regulation of membrane protease activity
MAAAAATAANPTVALNPFGVLLTLLTWASLLGINAWCFRRILRQSQKAQ